MTLEEDRDQLAEEAMNLWYLVHDFVRAHRTIGEIRYPRLYQKYDRMCSDYGETPVQVKIDTSKQK